MSEARVDRSLVLNFKGDSGMANLHRVGGWLSAQVVKRTSPGTRVAVWSGTGFLSNVTEVADGAMELAAATPTCAVALAREGRLAGHKPMPQLRALGSVPQFDRLLFAVRTDVGVSTFEEIRQRQIPLRVSVEADDGESFIGMGTQVLLDAVGLDPATLERWGGGLVPFDHDVPPGSGPFEGVFGPIRRGDAEAVIMEAMMVPMWQELALDPGIRFLTLDEPALARIDRVTGWPCRTVPAGYFPRQEEPFIAMDFSDFLIICRDDLPDDVAYLLAWSMGETRSLLEGQYLHIPPERSPVTYPLDPVTMGQSTMIPLHTGAHRYYATLANGRRE